MSLPDANLSVFLFLLCLQANLCSLGGCCWLVWRLRQHFPNVRRRLFPRQLHSLAFADLFFHTTALVILTIDWFPFANLSLAVADTVCHTTYIVFRAARFTCLLHETHIAISFVAQTFRWMSALRILNFHLVWLWVLGALLATYAEWTNPWTYDANNGNCKPARWKWVASEVSVFVLFACTLISVAAYVCVVIRSCWRLPPQAVKVRNFRRAASYLLNVVLTYGLVSIAYCRMDLFRNVGFFAVASVMELYNGFFNSMTYALQSRYAAAQLMSACNSDVDRGSQRHEGHQVLSHGRGPRVLLDQCAGSFCVDIGGVDIIDILPCGSIISEDALA